MPHRPVAEGHYLVQLGDSVSAIVTGWMSDYGDKRQAASQWVFEHNPLAFLRGDINQLQAGTVLVMPQRSDLSQPLNEPQESVAGQNGNAVVASKPSQRPADVHTSLNRAKQILTAQTVTDLEQKAGGLLRVAQTQLLTGAEQAQLTESASQSLKAHLVATNEVIDQLRRDNTDLRRQVHALENSDYLELLNQMITLQQEQIAALKAQSNALQVARDEPVTDAVQSPTASQTFTPPQVTGDTRQRPAFMNIAEPVPVGQASASWFSRDNLLGWLAAGLLLCAGLLAAVVGVVWVKRRDNVRAAEAAQEAMIPTSLRLVRLEDGLIAQVEAGPGLPTPNLSDPNALHREASVLSAAQDVHVETDQLVVDLNTTHVECQLQPKAADKPVQLLDFANIKPLSEMGIELELEDCFPGREQASLSGTEGSVWGNMIPHGPSHRSEEEVKKSIQEKSQRYLSTHSGAEYGLREGSYGVNSFLNLRRHSQSAIKKAQQPEKPVAPQPEPLARD
ncbi:hypothetical protein GCM10027217_18620 [Pseudomaricurvus hydrocarbonicus]